MTLVSSATASTENFTLADFKLFHQFTTSTWRHVANDPVESSPWVLAVPSLATEHPFLLHEVMAIAAVDLSTSAEDEATVSHYLEQARLHHAKGLNGLMRVIAAPTAELIAPAWACNSLFVPYYFATTANVASLLFTAEPGPGPAEWMMSLRGGRAIFKLHEDALLNGPWSTHLRPYIDRCLDLNSNNNTSEKHVLHMIRQLETQTQMTDEEELVMVETFATMRQCFSMSDKGDMLGKKSASLVFCANVPDGLFPLLARHRRAALVVMAHWCVLLHRVQQDKWWLSSNRVKEMLAYIAGLLGPESRGLIQWPIDTIGLPED